MKKFFLSILVLASSSYVAAQTFDNASACSVVNLEPILEEEDANASLVITPQKLTFYNCKGEIEKQFIQYEFELARKALGMTISGYTYTISGNTLCLIKVLSQKTLNCMDNGGDEGFWIDNGEVGHSRLEFSVYERKKGLGKGWRLVFRTNDEIGILSFQRKSTYNVVKALSQIETE